MTIRSVGHAHVIISDSTFNIQVSSRSVGNNG